MYLQCPLNHFGPKMHRMTAKKAMKRGRKINTIYL